MSTSLSTHPAAGTTDGGPVWIDEYGLLRSERGWVALSEAEWRLLEPLVSRFGSLVTPHELTDAAWARRRVGEGALNVLVRRARQRIRPLGLTITNVRGRGYLVEQA